MPHQYTRALGMFQGQRFYPAAGRTHVSPQVVAWRLLANEDIRETRTSKAGSQFIVVDRVHGQGDWLMTRHHGLMYSVALEASG